MQTEPWFYAALALVAAFHLGLIAYWARRTMGGRDAEERRAAGGDDDGTALQCPECGTANATGYQFCRDCVADLSGATRTRSTRSDSWNPF